MDRAFSKRFLSFSRSLGQSMKFVNCKLEGDIFFFLFLALLVFLLSSCFIRRARSGVFFSGGGTRQISAFSSFQFCCILSIYIFLIVSTFPFALSFSHKISSSSPSLIFNPAVGGIVIGQKELGRGSRSTSTDYLI